MTCVPCGMALRQNVLSPSYLLSLRAMKWPVPLQKGIFLKRYKRFFADIDLNGEIVVAHVPNTGSLKTAAEPGQPCWVTPATNPERKLKYTLEAVQAKSGAWVGVNTSWPNQLIKEAFENKTFKHWNDYDHFQGEVKISAETRLDACLKNSKKDRLHYVEVKNVTMALENIAHFPDAVTERGQKHLRELMALQKKGHKVEIVFTVQRNDVKKFSPADHIDPAYGKLLREASGKGVIVTAALVNISEKSIELKSDFLELHL
jgi:sugar fermentation stimulation protein A